MEGFNVIRQFKRDAIIFVLQTKPHVPYRQVAIEFEVGRSTVVNIARNAGIKRARGNKSKAANNG